MEHEFEFFNLEFIMNSNITTIIRRRIDLIHLSTEWLFLFHPAKINYSVLIKSLITSATKIKQYKRQEFKKKI